jgi:aminoglycoside phosphotransferase (APT) family kinase protein
VPSGSVAELPGGWPILLLTPVPGRTAASLLVAKVQPPEAVIAGLVEWLAKWAQATRRPGVLDTEWVERHLVVPATTLRHDLPESYLAWLRSRAEAAIGEPLSAVATHGDLTMTNVLLAGGSLGVVDWEAADADGLPLRDLLYAAVDATAARDGYRDRLAAFERCFPLQRRSIALLGAGLDRLRRDAGLTEATTTLCVHACWLQHAADERRKRGPDEARPFLSIVRHLAEGAARGEPAL